MEVAQFKKAPTVADVIATLSEFDPTLLVYLSRDEEGNGFAPLMELGPAKVGKPAREWMWSDELYEPKDREAPKDAIACLVLWPGA